MKTTVGQLLINSALPEPMRDYTRVLDKPTTDKMFDRLAKEHPDAYVKALHELTSLGGTAVHISGHSIGLSDLKDLAMSKEEGAALQRKLDEINDSRMLTADKDKALLGILGPAAANSVKSTLEKATRVNNPLAEEAASGARGNATQMNSVLGSAVLILDQDDRPSPVPVLNSYAHGLTPSEYWAQTYGTRKGAIATKMATADSGYLGKQLALAAHKLVVTDEPVVEGTGLPVDAEDPDNEGAVLAQPVGNYKAGTVITSQMINNWPKGTKQILVRSPISDASKYGGVPQEAAGVRERGRLADIGENIGIPAIQTISEKLSQGMLRVKHTGGAGGTQQGRGGFKVINQMVQVPKVYPEGAAHATADGIVRSIEKAPQGGFYVHAGDNKYYVDVNQTVTVKPGEAIEAGDALSDGLPNPAMMVKYKGIGEGRRAFTKAMREVLGNSGVKTNRRNIELLSRALVNHVVIDDVDDAIPGAIPGDIVEYDRLAAHYTPREGSLEVAPRSAKNLYIEKPVLHYSIGTRITPSVQDTLNQFGVKSVTVHKDPPNFTPFMQRAVTNLTTTPDWMERLGSFYVQKGFLDSVQRGLTSDMSSLSYIPALVTGQSIGEGD